MSAQKQRAVNQHQGVMGGGKPCRLLPSSYLKNVNNTPIPLTLKIKNIL